MIYKQDRDNAEERRIRKEAEIARKAAAEKAREEARKRREEARKRREAADAKRRREAKEKRLREAEARDEEAARDAKRSAENSFYTEQENNGIMKPSKPKFDSIDQIKDAQDAQRKLIRDMEKKQWNELSTGTDEIQIINKQNVADAKRGLANLDNELTDAYGLGSNGYLNKNSKSYGQKNPADAHKYAQGTGGVSDYDKGLQHAMGMRKQNPADAHKYAQGTGGVSDYDKGLQHAMGMGKQNPADAHKYAQGTGGAKRVTDESLQMARNPEHAYAIGTGGAKRVTDESLQMARNPEHAYAIGTGGAKRVTDESLQMARNPEHAYAIGTGGAKRVTDESLQMARNPEHAYAIGTGGAKRVTDESLQMARNPEHAYAIGTGGVRGNESNTENAYGQHTGGVSGNYKPPTLREAEQAVTAFDIAFSIIEEQTGVSDQATIMANIETAARGENGAIIENSTWGQAAMLLADAEMETGMTLLEAENFLSNEEKDFKEEIRDLEKLKYRIEIPEEVQQKILGKPEVVDYIWSTDIFKMMVTEVSKATQVDGIEGKVKLSAAETDKIIISGEDAKTYYNIMITNEKNERFVVEEATNLVFELALGEMGITGEVASFILGDSPGELMADFSLDEDFANKYGYDVEEILGGDFTISSFELEGEYEFFGGLKDEKVVTYGYVLHGEPIVLESGQTIPNPLNTIIYRSYSK
jgi:hypothetical protein